MVTITTMTKFGF